MSTPQSPIRSRPSVSPRHRVALGLSGGQTALWDEVTVDATAVLVRYSFIGDANLSGTIDGDDYFAIDSGYASHANGYSSGDFNYDGRIDADDYFIIDSNYGKAAAPALVGSTTVLRTREQQHSLCDHLNRFRTRMRAS